jgi:hypothetical protein
MEDILSSPITWAVVALLSELVGASKLKQNGVVALLLDSILKMKPKSNK